MATITLRDNRLFIDKEAAELLAITPDDRIEVRYWNEALNVTYPVVGKIDAFGDCEGRRVSKKLTVSYRGQQAQVLQVYGTEFELSPMENHKFFKMTALKQSLEESYIREAENDLEQLSETEELDW